MSRFKFFRTEEEQMVPVMCTDNGQRFEIPVIMYGNIMSRGVHNFGRGNIQSAHRHRHETQWYMYRINNTYRLNPDNIMVEYGVEFPGITGFSNFITTARLDLTNE